MGGNLLAELERCGVDTEYSFRADAASPRPLILLDDTGERTIIAVDGGVSGVPSASRHTRTEPSPPAITGLLSRSTPTAVALRMQVGVFQRKRRGRAEEGLGAFPDATGPRRREGAGGRPRRLLAVKARGCAGRGGWLVLGCYRWRG
jgi:hypothetical protein